MSASRNYRLIKKLGEGGFGVVYKATETSTDKTFAIKVMPTKEKVKDVIKNEIRILRRLSTPDCHEYVICMVDAFISGTNMMIVMEYFEGFDLSRMVGKITPEQLKVVAHHVLEGLDYIHSKGVAHGDIKLENILFNDSSMKLNVIDVGLSCMSTGTRSLQSGAEQSDCTPLGTTNPPGYGRKGTVMYFAPEFFNPRRVINLEGYQKADIFAFGVSMYELAIGELFDEDGPFTENQEFVMVSNGTIMAPGNIDYDRVEDEFLVLLIRSCLEAEPDRRPAARRLLSTLF